MKKIIITILLIGLVLFSGCSITGEAINQNTIKIGSILILTGDGSAWGIAEKNGIDMAVEDINSNGGINGKKLEVIHQDDMGDPKTALSAFTALTEVHNTDIIVGVTWSFTGLPLIDLIDEKEVLLVSPSAGVKELNEGSEFIFNTWPHDYILSEKLAKVVFDKGHKKVAIFGAKNIWVEDQVNAFTNEFENLGGSVEILVNPEASATEFSTEALKIKNSDVDAIILASGCMNVGALGAKRIREMGVSLPFYSMSIDDSVIEASSGAYEGMEYLTFLTPSKEFEQRYVEEKGINLQIGGDSAYDAVMLIAQAIEETGSTDTFLLQEYLNDVKSYQGVSGLLISDGKGGFTKEYVLKQVVDGKSIDL